MSESEYLNEFLGNVIVKKDFKSKHAYVIKSGAVREENYNGIPDPAKHNQFYSFGM
jgi:hypothetical protein